MPRARTYVSMMFLHMTVDSMNSQNGVKSLKVMKYNKKNNRMPSTHFVVVVSELQKREHIALQLLGLL